MTQRYCWRLKTWDIPGHKVPATDYLHPESPFPHHLSHPRVSQRMRGFRLGHLLILSELIHWWSCCNSSVWFMEVLHTTSRKAMCTLLWVREEPTTQSPLHLLNSACPRNPVASHQNSAGPGRLEEWNFHFHKMSIPVLFCSGLTSPQATFTFRRCKSLLCSGLISPQASSNVFLQTHLVSSICNLTSWAFLFACVTFKCKNWTFTGLLWQWLNYFLIFFFDSPWIAVFRPCSCILLIPKGKQLSQILSKQ